MTEDSRQFGNWPKWRAGALDVPGPGVIIPRTPGTLYENQAGGISCLHPQAEGVFVPLALPDLPHVGCYGEALDDRAADLLDAALAALDWLKVDRSRLSDGTEAWVPVLFHGTAAWLVYENCD